MSAGVVCCIDGSRRSWAALRLAGALATRCDLRLSVLDARAGAERLVDAGRRAAVLVIGGARTGARSASLTRRSACPVIVAPSQPDRGTPLAGTAVLCAVRDERDLACAATAACWACDLGMGLTLARVIGPPPMQRGVPIAAPPPVLPPTPAERAVAAADALVRLAAEISAVAPDDVRTRVAFGTPARQLRRLADSEGAAMIVVGCRRHGAFREALCRSPTSRLLRRGPHPVMVCPRPEAAVLSRGGARAAARPGRRASRAR